MNGILRTSRWGSFWSRRLAPECFAELAPECGLYCRCPNAKQAQYIRRLVAGVADHAAELDDYIARYAQGWRFERIPADGLCRHAGGHV